MTVVEPRNAAEAVANGAQLLDDNHPGWWRLIDLDTLHIGSCTRCVCGQLATALSMTIIGEPYLTMRDSLGLKHGAYHGFAPGDIRTRDLDAEWTQVITARLAADALDEQPAAKELVYA
jgi:hypothetical protein